MIVTVTPNPSIDRTVTLATPLTRGAVHRVTSVTTEPGGKGVNVARALTLAGVDAVARAARRRAPTRSWPPCRPAGCRSAASRSPAPVRTNLAITESDGTTTKLNEPGARSTTRRSTRSPGRSSTPPSTRLGGDVRLAAARHAGRLVRRRRRDARPAPVQGRRRHLRAPARRAGRGVRPRGTRPHQAERRGARRIVGLLPQALEEPSPRRSRACRVGRHADSSTAASAPCWPPSAPRARCSSTRPAAGWPPPADRSAQHRRRGRLRAGRLPPRRGRRRRAAATAADGRRLRQRRGRTAGLRTADARRDRPECRSGVCDLARIHPPITTTRKVDEHVHHHHRPGRRSTSTPAATSRP